MDRNYGGSRGGPRKFAPVNVGDELNVRIEAVGEKGDGIAKKDGFVLFVPNTKENEEVKIKVTKVLRKIGFAEVVGQASGPVETSSPREPARAQTEQDDVQQDSDDFGEEPSDAPSDEPAEDSEDFGEEEQKVPDDEDDLDAPPAPEEDESSEENRKED